MVFPVGIAIAKPAWANHSHAQSHTNYAARECRVGIELRRETGRKIGLDRRSSKNMKKL